MQRDWDLIRKILLQVEVLADTRSQLCADEIEGADAEKVSYHIHLLIDAGFIEGICQQGIDGPLRCFASSITWSGHEFLDKIRSTGIWNKVKSIAREKGLALSTEVIKIAATHAIATLMGGGK